MGKRNKLHKAGFSKKNYMAVMKSKKDKLNSTKLNNAQLSEQDEEECSSREESFHKQENSFMNNKNQTFVNESVLNRCKKEFGLTENDLNTTINNPMRHRRQINKVVLSKGQKQRLQKKEKFIKRNDLVEKIKLNQTMIQNQTMNKNKIMTGLNATMQVNQTKQDKFNLMDLDQTVMNLMNEINEEVNPVAVMNSNNSKSPLNQQVAVQSNKRSKKNVKKVLCTEKERIKKLMENRGFQNNPIENVKNQIKREQMVKERNKKMEENFQKNYNLLNMK